MLPRNLGGNFLFAYLMPEESSNLRALVNYWLRLQEANGFRQRMVERWIDGDPDTKQAPRWSIMRDVLGWDRTAVAGTTP